VFPEANQPLSTGTLIIRRVYYVKTRFQVHLLLCGEQWLELDVRVQGNILAYFMVY
jgi:hypothetical protein